MINTTALCGPGVVHFDEVEQRIRVRADGGRGVAA